MEFKELNELQQERERLTLVIEKIAAVINPNSKLTRAGISFSVKTKVLDVPRINDVILSYFTGEEIPGELIDAMKKIYERLISERFAIYNKLNAHGEKMQ